MEVSPKDEVFAFGDSVVLNCTARGGPVNIFSWNYNGTTVYNQTVTITNLTVSNALTYTCTVGNPAGNGTDTTQVYLEPMFILTPVVISTKVDDVVRLSCLVQGNPIPDIIWEYKEMENETEYVEYGSAEMSPAIGPESRIHVFTSDNGLTRNGTLEIANVTFTDYSVYRCTARSAVGDEIFSISSNITLRGEFWW